MADKRSSAGPSVTRLNNARDRMFKKAAVANSLGLLSRDDVRRQRWLLKRGAPDRRPRYAPALRELAKAYDAERRRMEALLAVSKDGESLDDALDAAPVLEPTATDLAADRLEGRAGWTEEELAEFVEKYEVVQAMKAGCSGAQAVKKLGIPKSPRWARNMFARYREHGLVGLIDLRKVHNGRRKESVTIEAMKRVWKWVLARPAAGDTVIARHVLSELRAEGITPPSESTLVACLKRLPPEVRSIMKGDTDGYRKNHRPVMRAERASRPNERVQADHSTLKIWGKAWNPGKGTYEPIFVYLTLAIDVYSRAIMGWLISAAYPDSWSIALTLRHVLLPKDKDKARPYGGPDILQVDRGRDFRSTHIEAACKALGIDIRWDPPRNPDSKGVIERLFRTIDQQCMRLLPGHKAAIGKSYAAALKHTSELLTLPEISESFAQWVDEYHERVHTTTRETPIERWRSIEFVREVREEELDLLLLKSTRPLTVKNVGIRFMYGRGGGFYHSVDPTVRTGRRVVVRYNPDDLTIIRIYDADTGDDLGDAQLLGSEPGQLDDIRRDRRWFKRSVNTALSTYAKNVRENDRPKAALTREAAAAAEKGRTEREVKDPEVRSKVDEWMDIGRAIERGEFDDGDDA